MTPVDLIRYITWYATSQEISLTTIRLVKFVYLCDLYEARRLRGKTITGFPWAFVYYGPYCRSVWDAIQDAATTGLIAKKTYESHYGNDKEYSLFICTDQGAEHLESQLSILVSSQIQAAIRKYGDYTAALLDHVYFETEPMEDVNPGDLLDFSKAKPLEKRSPIKLKELTRDRLEVARNLVTRISERVKKGQAELAEESRRKQKYIDENYIRFREFLDGEELDTGLTGTAKIDL